MKKILITIRNLILGLILIVYLTFIIAISTLLLNRNDYGMTQFGDKTLILLEQEVSNQKYKKGSLVITKSKKISELKVDDEIFVYKTNKKTKSVNVVIAKIGKINLDTTSPYVVLANDGTAWGEDFIAGTAYQVYENVGTLLSFIQSKWIFFCLLIVPCFFILLYEIHLVIVTVKFGDLEEEEQEEEQKYKSALESKDEEIEELMKELKKLKKEQSEKEPTKTKKQEKSKEESTKKEKKKSE